MPIATFLEALAPLLHPQTQIETSAQRFVDPTKTTWVTLTLDSVEVFVEYRPGGKGYGISRVDNNPDEIITDPTQAALRVANLLQTGNQP